MKKNPSLLLDTKDFIRKIEGQKVEEGTVLLTLDVQALYSDISHSDAHLSLKKALDIREFKYPLTHFLLYLTDIILEKNSFTFKDNFYMQTSGIAVGGTFVPSTAKLLMSTLNVDFITNEHRNPFYGDAVA